MKFGNVEITSINDVRPHVVEKRADPICNGQRTYWAVVDIRVDTGCPMWARGNPTWLPVFYSPYAAPEAAHKAACAEQKRIARKMGISC
jgi:hypothetical protein